MPELPEVETTRRGVEPHVVGKAVTEVVVQDARLRWPVPPDLSRTLSGQTIIAVTRRGKYLLFRTTRGILLVHLGMSGSLRVVSAGAPRLPHEHVDIVLGAVAMRLRDPRRFGAVLYTEDEAMAHPLLRGLGPEPLSREFDATYLHRQSRGRRGAVKSLIMDARTVVGVGNIYANEALFRAGIRPGRAAGRLSRNDCDRLVKAIVATLEDALREGGTTLRDFVNGTGEPGHFAFNLRIYGRTGEPCCTCGTRVRATRIGNRSSFFCSSCQR